MHGCSRTIVLHVALLEEGGHIAAIVDQASGVNPLWQPPWPSIEPSAFDAKHEALYGSGADARLLAGIMGHNLCLDIFGGPSDAEAAAGLPPMAKPPLSAIGSKAPAGRRSLTATCPLAQMVVQRQVELQGRWLRVTESVENLAAIDRPIGWTQHVTMGPPFLERGRTEFRLPATRSEGLRRHVRSGGLPRVRC